MGMDFVDFGVFSYQVCIDGGGESGKGGGVLLVGERSAKWSLV
jgi:hypothetical protein